MENKKGSDHNNKSDKEGKFSENASKNISGSGKNKENQEIQKTDIVESILCETEDLRNHFLLTKDKAVNRIAFMESCRKQGFFTGCSYEYNTREGYLDMLKKVDKLFEEWNKNSDYEIEIVAAGYKEAKEFFDEFPDLEKMKKFKKTAEKDEDKLNTVKKILREETDENTEEEEYITEEEKTENKDSSADKCFIEDDDEYDIPDLCFIEDEDEDDDIENECFVENDDIEDDIKDYISDECFIEERNIIDEYFKPENKIHENSNLDKRVYRKIMESIPIIRLTDTPDAKINMEAGYAKEGIENSVKFIFDTFEPNIGFYCEGYSRMTNRDSSDVKTALELTLLCAVLTFNPGKDGNFYEFAEDCLFAAAEREKRITDQLFKPVCLYEDDMEFYEDDDIFRDELKSTKMLFECPEFHIIKETFLYLTYEEAQYLNYVYSYDGSIAEFIDDQNLTIRETETIRDEAYSNVLMLLQQFMKQL